MSRAYCLVLSVKGISINRCGLAEANDGGGEMDEGQVAVVELLEANQELAEAVEPAVRRLHDLAPVLGRPAPPGLALLADPRVVAPLGDGIERRLAGVAAVGTRGGPAASRAA